MKMSLGSIFQTYSVILETTMSTIIYLIQNMNI